MTIFIADKKFKITLHIITNKKTLRWQFLTLIKI
jgi:hypothetical protein